MANAPSKLEPHRQFIAAERRRGTTYRRIAELLAEKGAEATCSTIHNFVKVRSKRPRKVITMYEPEAHPARAAIDEIAERKTTEQAGPSGPTTPARMTQAEAINRLKKAKPAKRAIAKGLPSFREDSPLDRIDE